MGNDDFSKIKLIALINKVKANDKNDFSIVPEENLNFIFKELVVILQKSFNATVCSLGHFLSVCLGFFIIEDLKYGRYITSSDSYYLHELKQWGIYFLTNIEELNLVNCEEKNIVFIEKKDEVFKKRYFFYQGKLLGNNKIDIPLVEINEEERKIKLNKDKKASRNARNNSLLNGLIERSLFGTGLISQLSTRREIFNFDIDEILSRINYYFHKIHMELRDMFGKRKAPNMSPLIEWLKIVEKRNIYIDCELIDDGHKGRRRLVTNKLALLIRCNYHNVNIDACELEKILLVSDSDVKKIILELSSNVVKSTPQIYTYDTVKKMWDRIASNQIQVCCESGVLSAYLVVPEDYVVTALENMSALSKSDSSLGNPFYLKRYPDFEKLKIKDDLDFDLKTLFSKKTIQLKNSNLQELQVTDIEAKLGINRRLKRFNGDRKTFNGKSKIEVEDLVFLKEEVDKLTVKLENNSLNWHKIPDPKISPVKTQQKRKHALLELIKEIYIKNSTKPPREIWNLLEDLANKSDAIIQEVDKWTARDARISWISHRGNEAKMKRRTFENYLSKLKNTPK